MANGPKDKARRDRYRNNNMHAGKCMFCPREQFMGQSRCLRHMVFMAIRKRGLLRGVQTGPNVNKREALVAYLHGRETAIRDGMLVPGDDAQRLKDVIELRLRLGIGWGGVRGADKMVEIVKSLDRYSLRQRKKNLGQS